MKIQENMLKLDEQEEQKSVGYAELCYLSTLAQGADSVLVVSAVAKSTSFSKHVMDL